MKFLQPVIASVLIAAVAGSGRHGSAYGTGSSAENDPTRENADEREVDNSTPLTSLFPSDSGFIVAVDWDSLGTFDATSWREPREPERSDLMYAGSRMTTFPMVERRIMEECFDYAWIDVNKPAASQMDVVQGVARHLESRLKDNPAFARSPTMNLPDIVDYVEAYRIYVERELSGFPGYPVMYAVDVPYLPEHVEILKDRVRSFPARELRIIDQILLDKSAGFVDIDRPVESQAELVEGVAHPLSARMQLWMNGESATMTAPQITDYLNFLREKEILERAKTARNYAGHWSIQKRSERPMPGAPVPPAGIVQDAPLSEGVRVRVLQEILKIPEHILPTADEIIDRLFDGSKPPLGTALAIEIFYRELLATTEPPRVEKTSHNALRKMTAAEHVAHMNSAWDRSRRFAERRPVALRDAARAYLQSIQEQPATTDAATRGI